MIEKTVICIIYNNKQVLLQLRDNNKNIIFPNKWGFFGGKINNCETHLEAVKREMFEELNINNFNKLKFINTYFDNKTRNLFFIYIHKLLNENLVLKEGADCNLFKSYEFLKKKKSKKIGKIFEFADKRLMKIFMSQAKRFL